MPYEHGEYCAGQSDRQQLSHYNQERPSTASRQQAADNVRIEDLDIYIVSCQHCVQYCLMSNVAGKKSFLHQQGSCNGSAYRVPNEVGGTYYLFMHLC